MDDLQNLLTQTPWAFQGELDDKEALVAEVKGLSNRLDTPPFFSLITPLWDTPPQFLSDLIGS